MSRDIKFRAWDSVKKRFASSYDNVYLESEGTVLIGDGYNGFDRVGYVVQLFTGLKDKNGNEIYEGDIIKWPIGYNDFSSLIMYVGYNELGMRLYKRLPCECCGGHKGGSIPSFGIFKKCEVIGNIDENLELLK